MGIPASKPELLSAIEKNFGKLIQVLRTIPEAQVQAVSLDGHVKGTRMSVANLVAYLIGWNELVLKWLERDAAGQPIDFPETGYGWNQLGKLAQAFYSAHNGTPWDELVLRLLSAKDRIVSEINERSDDELYGVTWYGKWSMGRMIQFNSSAPYANARARLRKLTTTAAQST